MREAASKYIRLSRRSAHARMLLTFGVILTMALALIGAEYNIKELTLAGTIGSLAVNILWIWEDFN